MIEDYKNAIDVIRDGGIGVLPTDTLYGVVGSAFSKEAVERIYKIKVRDRNKPFIVLISQIEDLEKFHIILDEQKISFLKKIWPNSVSVILPCTEDCMKYLHRGEKSISFRIPKGELLRDFIKITGPLVAPSANIQNEKPSETIAEARKYFADTVDFYIDQGHLEGTASTIISLINNIPYVIRQGEYKFEE